MTTTKRTHTSVPAPLAAPVLAGDQDPQQQGTDRSWDREDEEAVSRWLSEGGALSPDEIEN